MRRSTTLFCLLALLVSFILFKVKYEVVEIEQRLSQTLKQIQREEETIHILRAEWSHLNEPQRLQKLAEAYLDIGPIKTDQIVAILNSSDHKKKSQAQPPQSYLTSMEGENEAR